MEQLDKHSLKNFTPSQIESWVKTGKIQVAQAMNIGLEELDSFIDTQEAIVAERKQHPTLDIDTPERQALRDQIIKDYFECFKDVKKEKSAIIVLGQIASGKSSFCKSFVGTGEAFVVDVDFIKQGFGTMKGLQDDFDNGKGTDQVHEEASMLAKKVISLASDEGYNLVLPKTGIEFSSIKKIVDQLKSKGYYIGLCYIDLPIEKCVERNFYRFVDEVASGKPSRLVPFSTIKYIDDKPFNTFVWFLDHNENNLIDDFVALSNDVAPGSDFEPISLEDILAYAHSKIYS